MIIYPQCLLFNHSLVPFFQNMLISECVDDLIIFSIINVDTTLIENTLLYLPL